MYDVSISLQASGGSSDTQMCHRFVNFETFDKEISEYQVQSIINDYIKVLTQNEGVYAIAYHKCNSELKDGAPG